jgi:hypothetical protein
MTEQHRDELPPTRKAAGVALGLGLLHGSLKLETRKELEQLVEDAAKSHRGWPPADAEWSLATQFPPSYGALNPFFVS